MNDWVKQKWCECLWPEGNDNNKIKIKLTIIPEQQLCNNPMSCVHDYYLNRHYSVSLRQSSEEQ